MEIVSRLCPHNFSCVDTAPQPVYYERSFQRPCTEIIPSSPNLICVCVSFLALNNILWKQLSSPELLKSRAFQFIFVKWSNKYVFSLATRDMSSKKKIPLEKKNDRSSV